MSRRLAAVLALAVVPWTVAVAGTVTFVFPFALVDPNTGAVTTIFDYYVRYTTTLPQYLRAWGIGVGCYLGVVASVLSGRVWDVEDRRVTAGLLVFAGLTQLSLAYGFSRQPGRFGVPVGTVLCLAVVWWYDWPAIRLRTE
ncbi:TIGR04206 family protein [Halobacteriales archaeon QS_4_62_28]|nr:MAG: TIGR04206 family protein [Halobacteriales archaeon QS_4_62_28]